MENESGRVLVLIRVRAEYLQACRNSLSTQASVLSNTGGRVIGVAENMQILEGDWQESDTLALLEFTSQLKADTWYRSTPQVHQKDWLHGCDIISLPLRKPIQEGKPWMMIVDTEVYDRGRYENEFTPQMACSLDSAGALSDVVKTTTCSVLRGAWKPCSTDLHQWESQDRAHSWYCGGSPETKKLRALGREISASHVILFELAPLRGREDIFDRGHLTSIY